MTIQFLFRTNRYKWNLIARSHICAYSKNKRNQQPRRKLLISFLFSIKWRDLHNKSPVLNNNSRENRSVLFNNDVKMNFFSTNYSSHANDLNIKKQVYIDMGNCNLGATISIQSFQLNSILRTTVNEAISFTYLSLTQLSEWISICFMNAVKTSQIMIDYIGWDISEKIQCFQYKCKQIKILSGFSMTTMATHRMRLI